MSDAGDPRALTLEEIGQMAEVYCQHLSILATMKITGRGRDTVEKYVNDGDPSRGIPSIKSQIMATGIKIPNVVNPTRYLERSAEDASSGSKALLRAVKEVFALKISKMLRDFEEAYDSGDDKKVSAVHEKYDKDIRFKDLPRILDVEQIIWGLKTQGAHINKKTDNKAAERKQKIAAIKAIVQDKSLLLNREGALLAEETTPQVCDECGADLDSENVCSKCGNDDQEESEP